ncbi:phosphate/phosphite/phosphonate ABC transporter substrate-binding protein [Cupriavidus agavae]|uniref:ABC-type phosphate/phosphonate transport system substrate-binding protein n=1 Tax=Cupriavidus agavae TaxID=1001822 RepID=A0A4Q7S2M8_9BURK|nr:PhnD/SsuA/transferrin family substrate-binding protein [Cupriavidus agavae]RZT39172.1 ABC-type phosphate/phosphonate transport system substrate-binding protein [Cupriavidus agavae]
MAAGIASTRMYNATPAVAQAWHALLSRVFDDLGWTVEVIPHAWPAPLPALWQRPDLTCGFMCGLPFAQGMAPVVALAAPVPAPAGYAGHARYRSELLVRDASPLHTLEDLRGTRFGWMAQHSQSGYHAARRLLAPLAHGGKRLFAASIGPLDTPMRALSALRDGEIDVTALDSFFLDLLRLHDPAWLDGLRTVATTPWTPNPLLVASAGLPERARTDLVDWLGRLHERSDYAALLAAVAVNRFERPDLAAYARLASDAVQSLGYPEIQ